jgi:hypothetical protein
MVAMFFGSTVEQNNAAQVKWRGAIGKKPTALRRNHEKV